MKVVVGRFEQKGVLDNDGQMLDFGILSLVSPQVDGISSSGKQRETGDLGP
jgi:hypothetical protein